MSVSLDISQLPFANWLGMELKEAGPDKVVAAIAVKKADTAGAVATVLNLPQSATTTTVESKTNFLAPVPMGDVATATCEPFHKGGRLMVWQTRITRGDGRLCAVVTQSQMVLLPKAD